MYISDVDSVCTNSSLGTSTQGSVSECSQYTGNGRYRPLFTGIGGINSRAILDDQFEAITNKYLGQHNYPSVSGEEVTKGVELLKEKYGPGTLKVPIIYDLSTIQLTEADRARRPRGDHDENDEDPDAVLHQTASVATEFDRYYGTSLAADIPEAQQPYLDFSRPTSETTEKLNKLLAINQAKSLKAKTTLTEDIEQQFAIRPLRVSARQRKKASREARLATLPSWFDMPRVTEITKEQEKDLAALKMRHVWNAKSFYKKSSLEEVGAAPGATKGARYFQLGTVIEDKSGFYSDRVPKRQRKQTIVDELLHDQEARANQKRKLAAMMKSGRQRLMLMRAKQKRQKRRIKERKEEKTARALGDVGARRPVNTFRTYEL